MDDRRTISLALQQGERRQILLETGTTVLVLAGRAVLHAPLAWLAENTIAPETVLDAEEAWVADCAGWIDLEANTKVRAVVLPPNSVSFWRQIGQCLESVFGGAEKQSQRRQTSDYAGKLP
jgi:hypothetical protein